jgi:hypothetical protein
MKIYNVNISIYLFSTTRTFGKSPWSNTKLNCYQMPNQLGPNKACKIQKYIVMVKEKLDKLLEVGFIKLVETIKWVSLVVLALKKKLAN